MNPVLVLGVGLVSAALATAIAVTILAFLANLLRNWKLSVRVVDEDELRKAGL
jgi:Na+-driven multidrug efflux pump